MKQRPVTSVTSILRLALVFVLAFYRCGLAFCSDTKSLTSVAPETAFRLIIRNDMGMKQIPLADNKFPIVSQTLGTVIAEFENGIKVEIQQDSTIQVFLKTRRLTAEHGQGRIIFRKSSMPLERVVYNNRLSVSQYRGIIPVGAYYCEGGKLSGFTKHPNEIAIQYALGEGRGQIIRTLRAVAFIVNGYPFDGFSETITLLRDENTIPLFDAQTGTVWNLGSKQVDHVIWQNAPYGHSGTSGFIIRPIQELTSRNYYGSLLTGGQPFVSITNDRMTHVSFCSGAFPIEARITHANDGYKLFTFRYGFRTGNVTLPETYHIFASQKLEENIYLALAAGIRKQNSASKRICGRCAIAHR